ncbi:MULTISPECIES: hypothetical protein [Chryseobacterium]|uniref:hypothetical protein n=1 Tax=Chryseobacterium TaxID=59732 RepID=UPI0019211818|nr:hypothetical protein [Chryseobacterium sp. KMC2]MBL3549638.1 hypothetical protein [Chryseobacterium sp. KMC2]
MKKVILTMLLVTSTILLAKTEEPITKTNAKNIQPVLIAKKNIKEEKNEITGIKKISKEAMNLEGCIAMASYIGSYNPPLGAAMMGECVRNYN